jgi:hypothetical protein
VKGNNLLLEEYESPKYNPLKNGSFGPFGTTQSYLGGSAGREEQRYKWVAL